MCNFVILLLYFALSLNKYLNQICLSDGSIMWFRVKTGYEISQELQILSRSLSNCQSLNLDVIGSLNLSGIVNCVKEWLNHCGTSCMLTRYNLGGCRLTSSRLTSCRLTTCRLTSCGLTSWRLTGCRLTGYRLTGCRLTGCSLTRCRLTSCRLTS